MANPANALETAASIRSGERTATAVLEEHLDAIDRLNPELNAVCLRDDEQARSHAEAIDAEIAAGGAERLGPFAGVPMLIKDPQRRGRLADHVRFTGHER
ncbi:MAG: amidase family protein [Microthrixaceae bacterium]|nr:amidase family protein [Microthrixaceae bacterium]